MSAGTISNRRSFSRWIGLVCGSLVACVMLLAGTLKLQDVHAFSASLSDWGIPAGVLREVVAAAVPALEIGLGFAWLAGIGRRRALTGMVVLLTAFAAYGAWRTRELGRPPECACFGAVLSRRLASESISTPVWGSMALLVPGGLGLVLSRADGRAGAKPGTPPSTVGCGRCAGLTLIETLAVLAVVAVVVAIVIPALRGVRANAHTSGSLSNIRQHASVLTSYGSDYTGVYPCLTDKHQEFTILRGGGVAFRVRYFDVETAWNIGLADAYYEGNAFEGFEHPGSGFARSTLSEYYYSNACIADPRFFDPYTRTGRDQFRAVRQSEVSFPSAKGLLLDRWAWLRADGATVPIPVGFSDGSTRALSHADLTEPARITPMLDARSPTDRMPVVHTPNGVRGRDIQ